ncbi:hypothetical protein ACFR9U_09045 [Halorientalis brevis]|uniref:Uncharacterized protein n=1 Tax=Halorientalis brevis TaxID=1126241 RepID=A0ABD6CB95_9EURY|nr:hypothetical protein [Halorientalis brevis]
MTPTHSRAQDDEEPNIDYSWQALTDVENYYPNARFAIISPVVDWSPEPADVRDSWYADYNTRMIRWLNTGEVTQLFVAHDADLSAYVPELGYVIDPDKERRQPQLFEMGRQFSPFGDNPQLYDVHVNTVRQDLEDRLLQREDWWRQSQ